jgi:hypothetical protein
MESLWSTGKPFSGKEVSASQEVHNSKVTRDVYLLHVSGGRNAKFAQSLIQSDCKEVGRPSSGNVVRDGIL